MQNVFAVFLRKHLIIVADFRYFNKRDKLSFLQQGEQSAEIPCEHQCDVLIWRWQMNRNMNALHVVQRRSIHKRHSVDKAI